MRFPGILILAAAALFCIVGPARSASRGDYVDCNQTADLDRRIAGCGRVIDDQKEPPKNRATAHVNRGNAHSARGNRDGAMADYDAAIKLDPNSQLAFHNRGLAWQAKGDGERAIADFDQAIKLDSKSSASYDARGISRAHKGENERAIADFGEAIKLDPKNAQAYYNRGIVFFRTNDYARAVTDLSEAIRLEPESLDAYLNRGVIFQEQGDQERAIADLTRVIALRGTGRFEDFILRANSYRMAGNPQAAVDDIRRAGELYADRRDVKYFYLLGWNLYLSGRYDDAITALTSALAQKPDLYWANFLRGASYGKKGDRAKALEDLKRAVENIDPSEWDDETRAVFKEYALGAQGGR